MQLKNVLAFITDQSARTEILESRGFYDHLSDEEFLKQKYKFFFGKELDLEHPSTLCEKIQWLKLYDRKPEYTAMADKLQAKRIVSEKIGEQYVIPLFGNPDGYEKFDDIDFDELPDQFILKCTHNSGGFAICKDKDSFDRISRKKRFDRMLKRNYFFNRREWVYKNIVPRILAEKYIDSLGNADSIEYKVTCFNGKVGFVTICQGPAHVEFEKRSNNHFTPDFEPLLWYVNYKPAKTPPRKPEQWDEMIRLSEELAAGIPYLRVDWYVIDDQLTFGEFTFYTWSGFMHFEPPEWDKKLGDMLVLPKKTVE